MLDTGDTVLNGVHSVCPQGATFCWDGVWDGDQEEAALPHGQERTEPWTGRWCGGRERRMDSSYVLEVKFTGRADNEMLEPEEREGRRE